MRVIAFLLLCSAAFADPPKAVIDGPDSRKPGDVFVVSSASTGEDHHAWKVRIKLDGNPAAKRAMLERRAEELRAAGWAVVAPSDDSNDLFVACDGDKKIVLPTYPGDYSVTLAVSNADGIDLAEYSLTIEGTPGPGPGPVPDPVDPDPPTPIGLSAQVAAAVGKVVTPETRDEWLRLAEAYERVAGLADAGVLTSVEQYVSTSQVFDSAIAVATKPQWDAIKAGISDQLSSLSTVADYARTWKEIAAGIRTGAGAQPPPTPVDPVDPAPIPTDGLRVLIVREYDETAANMPASQQRIFTDSKVLGWLKVNAPGKWRIWDADGDASKAPEEFQAALKRPRGGLPWIVISNGTTGFEGPLPKTADETVALLEKYKP